MPLCLCSFLIIFSLVLIQSSWIRAIVRLPYWYECSIPMDRVCCYRHDEDSSPILDLWGAQEVSTLTLLSLIQNIRTSPPKEKMSKRVLKLGQQRSVRRKWKIHGRIFFFIISGLIFLLLVLLPQFPSLPSESVTESHTLHQSSPLCTTRWQDLSALDLAIFSYVSYEQHLAQVSSSWSPWLTLSRTCCLQAGRLTPVTLPKKGIFFHHYFSYRSRHVIAVRGTSPNRDWFENARIWQEIAMLDLGYLFIPLRSLWPDDTISFFVAFAGLLVPTYDDQYLIPLCDYFMNWPYDLGWNGTELP